MWELLYAGVAGGRKGVSKSIRSHPLCSSPSLRRASCPCTPHALIDPKQPDVDPSTADRGCANTGGRPRVPPSTPRMTRQVDNRSAGTTTTTPRVSRSPGRPPNCAAHWPAGGLTAAEFAGRCRASFRRTANHPRGATAAWITDHVDRLVGVAWQPVGRRRTRGCVGGCTCSASMATSPPRAVDTPRLSARSAANAAPL